MAASDLQPPADRQQLEDHNPSKALHLSRFTRCADKTANMAGSSNRQWISALFRILAVWIIVETMIAVPGFISTWYSMGTEDAPYRSGALWPAAVRLASSLGGAVALWVVSDRLAVAVWRGAEVATRPTNQWNATDTQVAAYRVLGVYLLLAGVPDLFELAAGHYTLPTGFGLETTYSGRLWARALGVGFQVAFGAVCFFAAPQLVRFGRA